MSDDLVASLRALDCAMVEVCEPHPGNPSANIIPVVRTELIAALERPSDTREWHPHLDYAGEPMKPGQFRDPPERLLTATEEGAREVLAEHLIAVERDDKSAQMVRDGKDTEASLFASTAIRAMLAFARHQSPTAPTEGVRDELPAPDKDGLVPIFRCDGTGSVIDVAHVPVWVRSALSRAGEKG